MKDCKKIVRVLDYYANRYKWDNLKSKEVMKELLNNRQSAKGVVRMKLFKHDYCHECDTHDIDVVRVGEQPDHESATACVCKKCLKKGLALLEITAKRRKE